mgnify:CR=1 FL=1
MAKYAKVRFTNGYVDESGVERFPIVWWIEMPDGTRIDVDNYTMDKFIRDNHYTFKDFREGQDATNKLLKLLGVDVKKPAKPIIAIIMEDKKISPVQLANMTGIPYRTIQDYYYGNMSINKASAINVYKIANALEVNMEDLIEVVEA